MPAPPLPHPFEEARLESVWELSRHTRTGDPLMVRLAREASETCGTGVGMVSLMEDLEEWVVACVGTEVERVPRAVSFCAHTILQPGVVVVEDASLDPRFRSNPFVVDEHHLRFYAGAAILDATGLPVGAVCVCHDSPMALSSECQSNLSRLAELASAVLESRLILADAQVRYPSRGERERIARRFDALLLALIAPRGSER